MMSIYKVSSGHYMCHPETCTCDNWQIIDPNGKRYTSGDNKKALQEECDRLNAKLANNN